METGKCLAVFCGFRFTEGGQGKDPGEEMIADAGIVQPEFVLDGQRGEPFLHLPGKKAGNG